MRSRFAMELGGGLPLVDPPLLQAPWDVGVIGFMTGSVSFEELWGAPVLGQWQGQAPPPITEEVAALEAPSSPSEPPSIASAPCTAGYCCTAALGPRTDSQEAPLREVRADFPTARGGSGGALA